ncbi:IclR family transcriptional regulator [Pelagibacterium nitratireducens]|uniref:IclR family transcriptional regulator n=1 Tax=Pelagibacterium nitratireducens TaxID=1046114 RepID=A0ABZ2I5J4_9HYPH
MDTTLLKGLRILEMVARAPDPCGTTELARKLGLNKSNVHRVLKTLEAASFVRKVDDLGRYGVTLKLWELGQISFARIDLKTDAQDTMKWLSAETRETVHLSVLDGSEVIYLDKIESQEPIRAYTTIGGRAPAYAVATGKALLAWEPTEAAELLAEAMIRHTSSTLEPAALKGELSRIREQGFAVNLGEWRESVGGIAAPIRNADGNVEAAIGISAPRIRIAGDRVAELATLVIRAASEISERLGYRKGR